MNKRRAFVTARWLLAGVLAAWTVRQAMIAGNTTVEMVGALHGCYALAGLLVTTMLAAPEVVGWALLPLHRMVDAVLLPGESEPPPVDYTLAHFYHRQMRYDEACEEYLKIVHYHPGQRRAYLEGMDAAGLAGQPELAGKFYRLGRRALRGRQTRRQLQDALEASHRTIARVAEHGELPRELVEDSPPPEEPTHG